MIIKITGYGKEEPKYFRLYDYKNNEIKDQHSQLMITNILKGIQYTANKIIDSLGPDKTLDIDFFSIEGKINQYEKILQKIGFWIQFKEVNQEEVVEF